MIGAVGAVEPCIDLHRYGLTDLEVVGLAVTVDESVSVPPVLPQSAISNSWPAATPSAWHLVMKSPILVAHALYSLPLLGVSA